VLFRSVPPACVRAVLPAAELAHECGIGMPGGPLETAPGNADRGAMRTTLWREAGSSLAELLIALTVLSIGLLTFLAVFASGTISIRQAGRVSTGAALADGQLELYRALTYSTIGLDPTALASTDSFYRSDQALPGGDVSGEVADSSGCEGLPDQCNPSRTLIGPDHGTYRVDTYVVWQTPAGGRVVKLVTVVVRDASNLAAAPLIRETSAFDQAGG